MQARSRVILLQEEQVALMKRVRDGLTYYTFPGGGVEEGETPEEAAVREAYEELGVHVQLHRLLTTDQWGPNTVYFYLASITGGQFGTGQGPEYLPNRRRGTYTPVWVPVTDLPGLDVRPRRVAAALASGAFHQQHP